MNGNRNRYTSAPLFGMNNRKGRQTDFSGGSDDSRNGGQPPSGRSRRCQWLIPLIALVLPALFVLSMVLPDNNVRNVCKMLFLALSLVSLAIMWGFHAFGKNARYSVSLVMIALMVISAVSLALTLPRNTGRTAASSSGSSAYFAGTSALDSLAVTPEDIGASSGEPDTARGDTAAGAAQMQLMTFMNYWGENDLDQMVGLCLPSWVNSKESPKRDLFFILTNRVPISYTIESISGSAEDDSRTITITCLIRKQSNSDPEYYRLQVLMIRLNNNWYVDPNSLSGTKVQASPAPDSPGTSAVTAVPTAIPTPTPPVTDQTMVYYNPNNGKYYHVAETCDKVASQYEPMTGIYYKDLNSAKYKNLLPCPYCHAPERQSIVSE